MESAERNRGIRFATNTLHEYRMRSFVQNLQNMLWVHSELGWFELFARAILSEPFL